MLTSGRNMLGPVSLRKTRGTEAKPGKWYACVLFCALAFAPTMLVAQAPGSAIPQVSIREGNIWIDQPGSPALEASENTSCNAIDQVEWIDSQRLALTCHINPSLEEYFEIDMIARRTRKDLLGF